jgi:hypothetical protein
MASNKIEDCCPELRAAWPLILADFESCFPGWTLKITCSHRTPEEQFALFKQGRSVNSKTGVWEIVEPQKVVTHVDGLTPETMSMHNYYPAFAFDVVVVTPGKDMTWNDKLDQWQILPTLAKRYGLVNGGAWRTLKDWPHFETKKKPKEGKA